MDINYIYHRRGVERLRAETAACDRSRAAHDELAERYRALIRGARASRNVAHPRRVEIAAERQELA